MTEAQIPFFVRLWLAIVCLFRIPFDPELARRVQLQGPTPAAALPEPKAPKALEPARAEEPGRGPNHDDALSVLALFQREGRLVDFLEQEIDTFPDADVGAAARVVHQGCRRALLTHFDVVRVRDESEGATVTVADGADGGSVKLTGDVRGKAPYRGVLRHAGWRVRQVKLPQYVAGHDPSVVAPAEVEL